MRSVAQPRAEAGAGGLLAVQAPGPKAPNGSRANGACQRTNLLGMNRRGLEAFFADLGEKPYRAQQVMKWLYHSLADDFDAMTNISKTLRGRLAEIAEIRAPAFNRVGRSSDAVVKWLASTGGGQAVETVLIPDQDDGKLGSRNTLCISAQAGCALDCSFCATGKQGFGGNLSSAEIVGQAWQATRELAQAGSGRGITNIVFMGMGEPLLNFDAVMDAADVFMDHWAFGISKRRVTVSTAGVVPRIYDLAARSDVSLAVSLHAADDALRDELVPINRKYPIAELLAACRHYLAAGGERRFVTVEYTLIDRVNDGPADARALVRLLAGLRCKVNLIPFNPFAADRRGYRRPSASRQAAFQNVLLQAGLVVTLRTTRGDEIAAACGQLTGAVRDRTRRSQRHLKASEPARSLAREAIA